MNAKKLVFLKVMKLSIVLKVLSASIYSENFENNQNKTSELFYTLVIDFVCGQL